MCQAMRGPGSKVTLAPSARAGTGASNSGLIRTEAVNHSADPLLEGCEPFLFMSTESCFPYVDSLDEGAQVFARKVAGIARTRVAFIRNVRREKLTRDLSFRSQYLMRRVERGAGPKRAATRRAFVKTCTAGS
jgi:hypothetical protein